MESELCEAHAISIPVPVNRRFGRVTISENNVHQGKNPGLAAGKLTIS